MTPLECVDSEELDRHIAAFEAALARDGRADLHAFLPDDTNSLYTPVLRELVRVDMEHGWTCGEDRNFEEYLHRFPALHQDVEGMQAISYEDYRQRCQAGERPDPEEYRRFGIDPSRWPLPHSAHDQDRLRPATEAMNGMPGEGDDFLGFRLNAELGRGAFARVFLARQGELADRPVVLKISTQLMGESRTLAQLQHTNIVPIYSIHHAKPFHAVCMPYLGSVTLADVLRDLPARMGAPRPDRTVPAAVGAASWAEGRWNALAGMTHVRAVLWLVSRLADGLAHAHERGILHRDLKPANVLLADDGQPLLLDFNLSEDTKQRSGTSACVGGTLPYMAPEQLSAFLNRTPGADARGDVYALGVILCELLTSRHPFPLPQGRLDDVLPKMIQDRRRPPEVRPSNPSVSSAVESIVQHCLEADPARRYHSARQLQEDLERQLQDLPLRHARDRSLRERAGKWVRRHPRLASSTSVAILAVLLLAALGTVLVLRGERLARLEAAESFARFSAQMDSARVSFLEAPTTGEADLARIEATCRAPLDRYRVLNEVDWQQRPAFQHLAAEEQERVRADAGEVLYLLANLIAIRTSPQPASAEREKELRRALDLNTRAEACYPAGEVPRALWHQRAMLLRQLGRTEEGQRFLERAEAAALHSTRDHCMLACLYTAQGRLREALPLWERASTLDPRNVWVWGGLGDCLDRLGQHSRAAACYSACIALTPAGREWYFRRGLAQLRQQDYRQACADFDQVLRQQADDAEGRINRALARLGMGQYDGAVEDLTAVIDQGKAGARVYLLRAQAREKAGVDGASQDREIALRKEPADEAEWVSRGVVRTTNDPQTALTDFEEALRQNPRSLPALENKAHILGEKLGRTTEAVEVLTRAITLYPEHAPARASLGTLRARLGRRGLALEEARAALALDASPQTLFQVAGIWALTSRQVPDDRRQAVALLSAALRQGYGHDLLRTDTDLDPIRDDPLFRPLLQAVNVFEQAPRIEGTGARKPERSAP